MRPIKFRGKRLNNGEWVYGSLTQSETHNKNGEPFMVSYIAPFIPVGSECGFELVKMDRVTPATVGQFTGLTDKNGKAIYEGDILRTPQKKDYDKENYVAYEVFWHDNDCASHHIGWQMNRCHFQGCICGTTYIPEFLPKTTATMEVIGNIHDNPELLGKKGGEE